MGPFLEILSVALASLLHFWDWNRSFVDCGTDHGFLVFVRRWEVAAMGTFSP